MVNNLRDRQQRQEIIFGEVAAADLAQTQADDGPSLEDHLQPYLCLCEAESGGKLRSFRQRQVLGALEPPLQLLDLQRRVDGPRLPHLLALAIYPCQFSVLNALLYVI